MGSIGNTNTYSGFVGAKFGSLLASPSGNTVNAVSGQILLGGSTTVKGGVYASQNVTVQAGLSVTGSVTAGAAINLGATATINGDLVSSSSITTGNTTSVLGSVTAATSVNMGTTALITGGILAGSGVTLGASSSVGQSLSGGNGTITLSASTTIGGNVSCNSTCYLNMSANDITIGGTTTVGYLYNWAYYRARFGGTITASYAYIYIGYDAVVNGDVKLNATYASSYGVYIGDRSVVTGTVSTAQTGGIQMYTSSTAQCARTLTTGTITLSSNARPAGVCCNSAGFGSSCSSSCVSNSSGLTMPSGCRAQEAFLGEVARYQFEESSWSTGGSVLDSSGYERHGTITGSPTQSKVAPPTCGSTYGVFAAGQRIKVPYAAALNPQSFSVAHWVRVDGGTGTFRGSLTSRTGAGTVTGFNLYAANNNMWQFWTGAGTFSQVQGSAVSLGTWTHVVATYQVTSGPDASGVYTGTGTIYINGAAAGSNTSMRYKPNTTQPLVIGSGGNEDVDFSQYPFAGALDDVRVFDYALPASEVLALSTSTTCPGGLPGSVWWSRSNSLSQADDTAVGTWANESNAAKPLTASSVAPKFRNSNALNINFNPVVEFTSATASDAAAQYFRANSLLGSKTWARAHMVFVGYPNSNSQMNFLYRESTVLPAGYADARLSIHVPWLSNLYWDSGNCCTTNRTSVADTTIVNTPSVFLFTMDSTAATPGGVKQSIRRDGRVLTSIASPIAFTGNASEFRVGFGGGAQTTFQGVMSEGVLFLGQTMTDGLATQLESYLGLKYGVTLGGNGAASTSYTHSGGGTTWAAGTGYHHNVVGLGRDDATKLNQLISRSSNSGGQITLTTGASMPSSATAIAPTTGVAFSANRSFVVVGDNGQTATSTTTIATGPQAGRTRSARVWRAQVTGTVPTQVAVCIPESMIPAEFLGGNAATDLWLTTASSADFATGAASVTMSSASCVASGVGVSTSAAGRLAVLPAATLQAWGGVGYFTVSRRLLDHLEITASSSSGVTCSPTSYTIKACADAACTSLYTGGVSGTLTLSGSGLTVNFPAGAGFTIPSGSSQVTVTAQVTTPGTATVGVTGLSITPGNSQGVFCGFATPAAAANSCAMTVADAGLLFDVPHHRSGVSQTITLSAVKKADNSLACKPAFTGAKSVNFKCEYLNPGSGTRPVLVSGVGLNAAAVTTSACDASGASRTLTFDANGQATTTVQYLDVGQVKLSASWVGSSGSESGLSLRGDDNFIAAPMTFTVVPASTSQVAGTAFGVTVTALNAAGAAAPNFGLESTPERPALVLHRAKPSGTAAQDGVFNTGTASAASNGVVSFSGLSWSEVGRAEVLAKLDSGSYLGSGFSAMKTTGGWAYCASQGGTCNLPAGVTATVSFDAGGASINYKHGVSGSISCVAASFPADPAPSAGKTCWYTVETGAHTSDTGTLIFKPHHFDVTTAAACGSFSYAAQPFTTTVTARNAQGDVTRNYDGSSGTSPSFAKTVNLSLASANATGTLSGSVAPGSFVAGVGADAVSFSFLNKLTPEQTISLRATDTDGVSSSTFAEGSMVLRSGRLVLSNAFGSEKAPLQIPMQLQYWSGKSWVLNSADTCTVISPASVVRARTLAHNNAPATWTSTISSVSLFGGSGYITLGAPSGGGTGSVDLAVNLGVGVNTADESCLPAHGNATGAGLPWLRSRQGSCASSYDRDPSARGTFGVYAPETRRSVHVREVF
ncbi:DUF6701 domain-containing protein [Ideonella paludis]|uniref:DUF6701 domain-containing protein n=1 Tax=Ideonella paludis TaxID=1233411 RepID=UPI003634AEC2